MHARLGDRSLFAQLRARAYLNHAAVSPPSAAVEREIDRFLSDYATDGLGALPGWLGRREALRGELAAMIGAQADEIAFMPSTTAGVQAIAMCRPWRPGDRVVVLEGEFPANVTPWQRAAELHGLKLAWLHAHEFSPEAGGRGLERLQATLREGAALVAVSAVQFQTGLRMPLAAISAACRLHGAELFVDAIQAVGIVPIDVANLQIDYLACGGHKWLMGPEGTAFLYAGRERAASLRPHLAGWLSHVDPVEFLTDGPGHLRYDRPIRAGIGMLEGAAVNGMGLAGLAGSIELLRQLPPDEVYAHVQAWHDRAEPALLERGFTSFRAVDPEARSGILSLRPPAGLDVVALHRSLGETGIACSIPDGYLRFAPHWPNALQEVEAVIDAVDRARG